MGFGSAQRRGRTGCGARESYAAAHGGPTWDGSLQRRGPIDCCMGSLAYAVVTAYGALVGHGSPQRRGFTSSRDGESCLGGSGGAWSAYGGWQPPTA